ncbi:MAG: (2Fe-2S)-binding protein [Proteobacteria bacterium]|nr:(2Fe-2S)-binding protein [Pseudomonadota bacterium]
MESSNQTPTAKPVEYCTCTGITDVDVKTAFDAGARTIGEVFDYHGKSAICAGCLIDINWLLGQLAAGDEPR